MVYARSVGDSDLTLIVSGMLWRDSLIMLDRESGSLWSHVLGEAISGPMDGQTLDMLPSVQTTWRAWREAHPDTSVLAKTEEIRGSEYQKYYDDPSKMGIFRARRIVQRMPGKELVWGVARAPHAAAIREGAFGDSGEVEFTLGSMRAKAVRGDDGGVRVFIADGGVASRRETGGVSELPESRSGQGFEEVPVTRVYWFAWSSFFPNTEVVEAR